MTVNENGNNSQVYPERLQECTGVLADGLIDHWYEYVPASYDGSKKVPLVVSNHGGQMNGWAQAVYSSWTLLAEREGFICVFPDCHELQMWMVQGLSLIHIFSTPAEACAAQYGIFIIAPDQHHSLCTSMRYGPRYEEFMNSELPGICRNNLPISDDPAQNWIGGVGTGAYGAVKMALKHPETFSKAIALNGILDLEAVCRKACAGQERCV